MYVFSRHCGATNYDLASPQSSRPRMCSLEVVVGCVVELAADVVLPGGLGNLGVSLRVAPARVG